MCRIVDKEVALLRGKCELSSSIFALVYFVLIGNSSLYRRQGKFIPGLLCLFTPA